MKKEDVLKLKDKIEAKKAELNEAQGARKSALKRLKDEHDCSSVAAAEKKLDELSIEIEGIDDEIEERMQELEEELNDE